LVNEKAEIKIADFGVSTQAGSDRGVRGTPLFMSPEIVEGAPYDSKADIWSLGITAIEMADGLPPHFKDHPLRAMMLISTADSPTLAEPSRWSALFKDFVARCVKKDPSERSTAEQLLKHPFIVKLAGGGKAASDSGAKSSLQALVAQYLAKKSEIDKEKERLRRLREMVPATDVYLSSVDGRQFSSRAAIDTTLSDLQRFESNLVELLSRIDAGTEQAIDQRTVSQLLGRVLAARTRIVAGANHLKKKSKSSAKKNNASRADAPRRTQSIAVTVDSSSDIASAVGSTRQRKITAGEWAFLQRRLEEAKAERNRLAEQLRAALAHIERLDVRIDLLTTKQHRTEK
jgi:serine/threonine protein kinase